jgi:hypothetical protein
MRRKSAKECFATAAHPENKGVGNIAGMQVEIVGRAVVGFEHSQGRLPNCPSGVESADVTEDNELASHATWDGVGRFGLISAVPRSRIVRAVSHRLV